MGLDVSLYKLNGVTYDEIIEMSNDSDEDRWEEIDAAKESIGIDSKLYPDELFKIGYFRSSYNEAGINRVLDQRIGKSLPDIFPGKVKDEYHVRVDWEQSLRLATEVKEEFIKFVELYGDFTIMTVNMINPFQQAPRSSVSDSDALKTFIDVKEKHKEPSPFGSNWFNSNEGTFFLDDSPTILAVIPGQSVMGSQVIHLIIESKRDENGELALDSYVRSLEIVEETCQWVLTQEDPTKYILGWSG